MVYNGLDLIMIRCCVLACIHLIKHKVVVVVIVIVVVYLNLQTTDELRQQIKKF